MKLLVYLALFLAPAFAQITEIATDATGQNLVLNTRFRLQTESDVTTEQKIYRWQNGVWTRLRVHIPESGGIVPGSIGNPFVAAGGSVYGWFTVPSHGLFPVVRIAATAEVFGITLPSDFPREYVRVSANGRFAAGAGGVPGELSIPQIVNAQTGSRGLLPLNSTLPQVGSDGSFAYFAPGQSQIAFRQPGSDERRFAAPGEVLGMAMSDDGRWIVVDPSAGDSAPVLRVLSTATGEWTSVPVAGNTFRGRRSWGVSNSGVVFLSGSTRLSSWDAVTHRTEVLAESAEPLLDLAVSADGSVAWAVSETNRLLRIDARTGKQQEILPPLGFSQGAAGVGVPGSAMLLQGKFTREQQVFVQGEKWPLSDVNASGYWFQVPWEWRGIGAGTNGLLVRNVGNPFENIASVGYQSDSLPYFPPQVDGGDQQYAATVIAAHSDFHGVVSSADPARGGENIHIYMTGLGALQRSVPTGVPGPYDAVPVARPLVCAGQYLTTLARTDLLTVPAIVYAGGMIGIYQVELTLPKNVPDGSWGLVCWDGIRETFGILRTRP